MSGCNNPHPAWGALLAFVAVLAGAGWMLYALEMGWLP